METESDVSRSPGVLVPASENSAVFLRSIVAPLQSAYLFEESRQSFTYTSGFLVKNPALEQKYNAYRAQRKDLGYSEEELKETYGFLLFDELSKAQAVAEAGVQTRNGTCSTLGDPSKGVYLSMYSDCLDLNSWYHGKSGYIAIIRLTRGRVKKVLENYTESFTTPTVGFDCHVSEQLPTVSSKTSSFLAFERTQYYMYELLDSGSSETAEAPSLVCPFAVVAFSYADTKAATETAEEKSEEKNVAFPYLAWTGQLQLGTQFHSVGLRSTAGSLVRAKLPPVVKVERAISMLDLRQLLPRAAFETSFSGEAFLDGLYCSLCELTVSVVEENSSFSQLLQEIKYKDIAFTVPLDDGGFLILLHSSHFFMYENDTGSNSKNVLQGMFVFPDSQVTQRGTKFEQKKLAIPSDIQQALPLLTYAEGEVEKTLLNPNKERNKVIIQHMQSYAALINPVLALSPIRDVSIFPDQYDVPDAHRHLYASPEWTDQSWQSVRSYLSKPVSFQVPVLTASEILAAGQEDRREDLDDDVYICLSSPEEAPVDFTNKASEEQVDQKSSLDIETSPAETKSPAADAKIFLAEVETSLAVFKSSLAAVETSLAEVETSLAEVETSLPEVDTSLPEVDTSLPEVDTSLPEVDASLPEVDTSVAEADTSIADAETSIADAETSIAETDTSIADAETSLESSTTNMEKQLVLTAVPQNTVPDDFQDREGKTSSTDTEESGLRNVLIRPISDDLPAELIVSITSAAQTVGEENLTVISTASPTKLNDSQPSVPSMEKLQVVGLNSLNDEVVKTKQTLECAEVKNLTKPHWGEQCEGHPRVQKKGPKHCTDTPRLLPPKVVPVKHDTGNVRRAKRKFRNLLSKRDAGEVEQQDSPKDMLDNTILKELEAYSLRKKTERWDLKPVISECGKILVPHGTLNFTDEIKSFKGKLWSVTVEQCPGKMLVDSPVHPGRMEQESSDISEMSQSKTKAAVQENLLDTLSSMNCATKEESMLTKLKSVLFRNKRKGDHIRSEKPNTETASDSELCPKRVRSDLDAEMLKSNNAVTCVQESNVCVQEVSKMLSVDLVFAQALGLTPKETPDKLQKAVGHKDQQRKDSSATQEQSTARKQPQIILRPPSIFPRRSRIKMLKKHQSVPAEHIRSKWWLHFQTPACFDTEKLKYKECARDISVRKTVKEKMRAACSPTDALNLLADLALSANKDQVPPQPAQALATKPESSLKNCDLTKGVTSPEAASFLHALLRQPAARPIQPLEPPSPSPVLGGSELVDLVSMEHAYSLPPSSSLLLGLPGTPFQVSPLSGSTRLLLHPQQKYGDGTQTLQPSVYLEEKAELNQRTPSWLKKCTRRRKFRHSRTFVNKDRTVQVTRQWEDNYDFNLDSRFTVDSLDKAVNRALHGPWDLSMHDTTEEVRLIIHMWIGLFYSRSTARFFHLDPNFTLSPLDDSDDLEMSSGTLSDALHLEPVSTGPAPSATDTPATEALDLSKSSGSFLDQGSVLLDLSLRTTDAEVAALDPKVSSKHLLGTDEQKGLCDTQNASKPSLGLHEASPFQCYRNMVHSKGIVRKVNDSRSIHAKQRTCVPSQKDDCLEHTDKPSSENDRISVGKVNVSILLPSLPPALEMNSMLRGSCNERTGLKDGTENSDTTKMCLMHQVELDLKNVVTHDEVKSNTDPSIESHSAVHGMNLSKDGENFEVKDDPHHGATVEDSSAGIYTDDDDKKSEAVCSEHVFEKETKHLKAHSPCQTESAVEDEDCTAHESNVIGDGKCFEQEDKSKKAVETGSDLSDQPLSIICDGPDSVKDDCITELDCQAPVTEEQSQADSRTIPVEDLAFKRSCANDIALPDEHDVSENAFINKEHVTREAAAETCSENDICLSDKATYKDSTTCLDVLQAGEPSTQMNHLEPVIQAELMANLNMHNEEDIKSVKEQQKVGNTTQEPSDHQAPAFQDEAGKNMETEVATTDEMHDKYDEESNGLWNTHGRVIIPFIGVDTSFEDIMESQFPDPKWKVQDKEAIPFISATTDTEGNLISEVNSATHVDSKHAELFGGKMPPSASDTKERVVCKASGSDDRCPTPTIDERPYRCAFSDLADALNSGIHRDITLKDHSRSSTPVMDETSLEHKSILSDSFCDGLNSDLELRTLRVLRSVDKFLSTLPHTNESSQNPTADTQHSLEKTPSSSIKCKPTHSSPNNISALASTSQELHTESAEEGLTLSSTDKVEDVQGVELQCKKMISAVHHAPNFEQVVKLQETSVQQDDSNRFFSSSEFLQTIRANDAQDTPNKKSKSNLGHEPCSTSHRPVMAVKPSKTDESQRDFIPKDGSSEESTKIPEGKTSTPRSMLSIRKTKSFKSNRQNADHQEAIEHSFKDSSTPTGRRFNLNKDTFRHCDSVYRHQHTDSSTSGTPTSSFSVKSFNPTNTASKHVDGHQHLRNFAKKVAATKYNCGEDADDCSQVTSFVDYKTNKVTDDTLIPGTQTSLLCTVHNNANGESSCSFLEQVSSRCLQEDPTQASMDQECLIFSEQMKRLLKRQFPQQQVPLDKSELPRTGPMTVHFSSLEEQDDSSEDFEVLPSLVGQKFKVDMSDRNQLRDALEEKRTSQLQKISHGTRNPLDKNGVSAMTEECTRLYEDMMNDICSGLKVSSTTKNSQMDGGYPKSDPGNYFDFCSQMKRELDERFRSHLNSVVKKSCKTKYRFFMLVTSDDAFFEETKVHLEAEGHTAVHQSAFFLDEDSPSSLLIIIRNEDIAEHICEVPHLLELKMSKGVRFVGIDEPDDIVNLTHQELFNRGGFVMFDGAALDSLSLGNVKKLADVLKELSQMGKWKWFMHYQESRRLKENARLCTEAKERKHYLNTCQEEGILELLPYHECDLMSRQQPDYLTCLCRLQVQNISARYPVFVTDATTDGTFGRSGIITMTVNSFLMNSVNMLT